MKEQVTGHKGHCYNIKYGRDGHLFNDGQGQSPNPFKVDLSFLKIMGKNWLSMLMILYINLAIRYLSNILKDVIRNSH